MAMQLWDDADFPESPGLWTAGHGATFVRQNFTIWLVCLLDEKSQMEVQEGK